MNVLFEPVQAAALAQKAHSLIMAGREIASFGETDPELAGECGVEICSLEARSILAAGTLGKLMDGASRAASAGQRLTVPSADLEVLSRLEQVVSLGASRINLKQASLAAAESQEPLARIGTFIGFATGAVGLFKAFF